MTNYQLPEIPLTPVDLVNRRAAATGSVGYAKLCSGVDYNGHHVSVSFKPHAVCGPIWNAEYFWGGRVVIGRGSLAACLRAAKSEYERGARGCVVRVSIDPEAPESEAEQIALFEQYGFEPVADVHERPYWTGTHHAVSDALSWERNFPGIVHYALQYQGEPDEWDAERKRWLESRRERTVSQRRDHCTIQ